MTNKYNIEALNNTEKRKKFRDEKERGMTDSAPVEENIERQWNSLKENIQNATEKVLGYKKKQAKKEWMTEEILDMMEKRRLAKRNTQKYNEIHQDIRHKIREAKNVWIAEQCKEAEKLHKKHDNFNFHKKLKKITNTFKKANVSKITKNNHILTDPHTTSVTHGKHTYKTCLRTSVL